MQMHHENLPINTIKLDLENPRIKQWIEIYGDNISSEGIALALSASSGSGNSSTYTALKESIKVNRGIINPIIVNRQANGELVVIEGNTRLQIYKEFAENDPAGPWQNIIAVVYNNLPRNDIHAIRLQTHLVGPRDWDPFSKAKYLNQLSNVDKLPMEMIISYCGGKAAEIRKLIDAYADMTTYYFPQAQAHGLDPDPREFSKFAELQNRSIVEALAIHHFTKNDFAQWVLKGHIDNAQNVRKIPEILAEPAAREVFLKNTVTEAEKYLRHHTSHAANLANASIDELAHELRQKLRNISYQEVQHLKYDPLAQEQKELLQNLEQELSSLLRDLQVE